ncbi:DUF6524 family protein [Defluviimonas sp. WL0024]|uniref:DUF6524 family protein n=2 Tax=Albidovulum TaxID=205889 RepID=A0ABT3J2L1_9RHOB|nr:MULTISPECIES: DUF6524 family protein [Defluviimonas]MCU9847659.1 DUF6524 family protein [Defluviimonas sp. WL0024]MCW3781913.1 DUF6524 family protein [Defluviimonas salinarum]
MGFLIRWLAAFGLLSATYNPTGWSFAHWARQSFADEMPLIVLAGLVLLIGYVIYLRATLRSIGGLGMALVAAVVAALAWVLIDQGLLRLDNPSLNAWLGIVALSVVLGIGLSWSHVRRRISGQSDMDDVGD